MTNTQSIYQHAIIVLGCGIDAAGDIGPDAKRSVRLAINALKLANDTCLIMTGYISYKATFKPSISEAQGMKDFAVKLDVPPEQIFVETESKDTIGNLYFTKQNLLKPLGITNVSIVRGPNQSTERVNYLIRKILGNNYSTNLIEPDVERLDQQAREKWSLSRTKAFLDKITDGDMDAIYASLRKEHPGYNSALSADDFKKQ